MEIRGDGICIDANVDGRRLTYTVTQQSKAVTEALAFQGVICDEETGISLRSNKRPSYNSKLKRFFVRGTERNRDNEVVTATFGSNQEARNALAALQRIVANIAMPVYVDPEHKTLGMPIAGGTTHVRYGIIPKSIARALDLTAKNYYPETPVWPGAFHKGTVTPITTKNKHYNEHIGQAVDVLNKHYLYTQGKRNVANGANIVNPHKVTPEQGYRAVEALRRAFEEAEEGGYAVAFWRIVTGIRGPDFTDNE